MAALSEAAATRPKAVVPPPFRVPAPTWKCPYRAAGTGTSWAISCQRVKTATVRPGTSKVLVLFV
ncbi:hypothetical protein GCM10015536_54470 [Streptomyces griseomycini]|nr:hypothetical protein GCM10015536_54470 [Streptomyces griseomycini]